MGSRKCVVSIAAGLSLLAVFATVALAGDAGKAKRDLMMAKDNAETGRWDDLDTNMKKVAADMEGLSDADKAPLLTQVAEIKGIVTKSVEEEVNKRLAKAKADPSMGKLDIDRANMRLNSDEAKNYADPAAIEKLRAQVAAAGGAPAPKPEEPKPAKPAIPKTPAPPSPPAPTTPPAATTTPPSTTTPPKAMSDDMMTATARARSAHNIFNQASGPADYEMTERFMGQAFKALEKVPDADKAALMADLIALNKQLDEAELKAQRAEEFRRVDEQVHRYVFDAKTSIQDGIVCEPDRIDKAADLLATSDVKTYMDADHIKPYQSQLDALRIELRAHNKKVALERCANNLKELETKVSGDPFKGTDNYSAYSVYNGLQSLVMRVRGEFAHVPEKSDPDIKAVLDRVTAAEAKIDAAQGKYAMENMEKQFAQSWSFESKPFAGWEAETLSPNSIAQRRVEGLEKTARALSSSVYWLNERDTKETLEKYKSDAVVMATVGAAQKTLDAAGAKLNDAFNAVIADAEKKPMPTKEVDRAQIGYLALDAAKWFAGTKYKDPNVARATALDTKWKADVARAEKEMEAMLKDLTAKANAAWPAIEASAGADKSFDPKDAGRWTGKTIEIKGYYNRSGWDFDAAYDYAVGIKGVPVAGNFEPNVKAAFAEGAKHTKFGIDDHVGWDLIAVVQGPGKINRRVTTEWKDANTHELIMKTESYVPEPCVTLKIIGLRAGPVAVGPK